MSNPSTENADNSKRVLESFFESDVLTTREEKPAHSWLMSLLATRGRWYGGGIACFVGGIRSADE